jgi:hypothetical protein
MSEQPEHQGYELAYQEGLRAIDQQQAVLEGLHRRAGTVLAVASIVTSFLGSIALGDGGPTGFAWLAIGLFLAAAGLVAYVLAPRREWFFRRKPRTSSVATLRTTRRHLSGRCTSSSRSSWKTTSTQMRKT